MGGRAADSSSLALVQPTYSGAMSARWLAVLLTTAAFVATPLLVSARPVAPSDMAAVELAGRVRQSADVAWSGFVETSGTLQVPDNESFATLGQLLGENTQLRVWWRNADDWRVDRIRSTGETDLFRQLGHCSLGFESETATYSPVSKIRLPDASTCCRQPSQGRCYRVCVRASKPLTGTGYRGHRCARCATDARRKGNDRRPCRYLGRPRERAGPSGGVVRRW